MCKKFIEVCFDMHAAVFDFAKEGSPQHVSEAQADEMQGAAEGGHPKQTTP
jgi:hypothetical protein